MDEWGDCAPHVEVVMTGDSGGLRRLLTARIAVDHGDNVDEPRLLSQQFNFTSVILVILNPRP